MCSGCSAIAPARALKEARNRARSPVHVGRINVSDIDSQLKCGSCDADPPVAFLESSFHSFSMIFRQAREVEIDGKSRQLTAQPLCKEVRLVASVREEQNLAPSF